MKTSCPCCGEIYYDIPDKWLGQKARCEHCGKEFTVQIYYPPPPEPVKPEFFIEVTCPICKNKFEKNCRFKKYMYFCAVKMTERNDRFFSSFFGSIQ